LRYAVGEVCLIVVGVSLALLANSWYQKTQEQKEELRALQQIRVALEADVADFSVFVETLRQNERDMLALWNAIQSGTLSEEFATEIAQLTLFRNVRIRSGPYEEIKNRGYALISNASIRSALIDLYERSAVTVEQVASVDRDFSSNLIGEYFQENFLFSPDGPWVPVNGYDALQEDLYFRNLVAQKLGRTRRFFLPTPNDHLTAAKQLLAEIDREIAGLSD
jgi:hypothetical protein